MATLKKCSLCKSFFNLQSFYKDKSTSSGYKSACKGCSNIKRKAKYHSNPYDKEYRNKPEVKQEMLKYHKEYREKNYINVRKSISEWALKNKDKRLATVLKYKYKKMKATANWDAELTEFVVQEAASLAKQREVATGYKWHIDHIIPLQGKEVCGLHVWNNLQLIPANLNWSKGNKFNIDL